MAFLFDRESPSRSRASSVPIVGPEPVSFTRECSHPSSRSSCFWVCAKPQVTMDSAESAVSSKVTHSGRSRGDR